MFAFRLSTFMFQLINFFILLGVLSWFFYRPLQRVMQQRADAIASRLHDAETRAQQAEEERHQLAEQSQQLQAEAEAVLAKARLEATQSRQQILERTREEAQHLIEEAHQRVLEQERSAGQRLEARLRQTAVLTAASLIREAAGPAIHESLIQQMLREDFGNAGRPSDLLRQALTGANGHITVQLAYPPSPAVEEHIRRALARTLGQEGGALNAAFAVESSLVAGVRILVGTVAVDLSLRHVLEELSGAQDLGTGHLDDGLAKPT